MSLHPPWLLESCTPGPGPLGGGYFEAASRELGGIEGWGCALGMERALWARAGVGALRPPGQRDTVAQSPHSVLGRGLPAFLAAPSLLLAPSGIFAQINSPRALGKEEGGREAASAAPCRGLPEHVPERCYRDCLPWEVGSALTLRRGTGCCQQAHPSPLALPAVSPVAVSLLVVGLEPRDLGTWRTWHRWARSSSGLRLARPVTALCLKRF